MGCPRSVSYTHLRIEELKSELAEWQQKQKEYADAKQEAEAENDVPTDDYYRLPAIMQEMCIRDRRKLQLGCRRTGNDARLRGDDDAVRAVHLLRCRLGFRKMCIRDRASAK